MNDVHSFVPENSAHTWNALTNERLTIADNNMLHADWVQVRNLSLILSVALNKWTGGNSQSLKPMNVGESPLQIKLLITQGELLLNQLAT